jgi:hypothetical protein
MDLECKRHKSLDECLNQMGYNKPRQISVKAKHWRRLQGGAFAQEKPLIRELCQGLL